MAGGAPGIPRNRMEACDIVGSHEMVVWGVPNVRTPELHVACQHFTSRLQPCYIKNNGHQRKKTKNCGRYYDV